MYLPSHCPMHSLHLTGKPDGFQEELPSSKLAWLWQFGDSRIGFKNQNTKRKMSENHPGKMSKSPCSEKNKKRLKQLFGPLYLPAFLSCYLLCQDFVKLKEVQQHAAASLQPHTLFGVQGQCKIACTGSGKERLFENRNKVHGITLRYNGHS